MVKTQTINDHLHDKAHRHHLIAAALICLMEIGLIMGVDAVMVHLLVVVALFGRDATEILLGA
jgi:hypothetical protein